MHCPPLGSSESNFTSLQALPLCGFGPCFGNPRVNDVHSLGHCPISWQHLGSLCHPLVKLLLILEVRVVGCRATAPDMQINRQAFVVFMMVSDHINLSTQARIRHMTDLRILTEIWGSYSRFPIRNRKCMMCPEQGSFHRVWFHC